MATVAELLVRIGGDSSGLRKEINNSQRQMRRAFGPEALSFSEGAAGVLGGIAVALGAIGIASVKMSSDFAANKTAFTTLLGSADKAQTLLSDLATFAADTPFELPGLIASSKKLLAFQFAAEDIIPIMSAVGDAVSLVGGGQEAIDGVVRALGQIQAKGKLSAEEMNQLSERGINGWKYIADEMGISVAEVMALCQKGAIDSTTAINAVVKGMQTNFKGGMEGMAKTVPGLLSTIKDNAGMVLKQIGDQITTSLDLQGVLQKAANYLTTFSSAVGNSGIKQAILGLVPPEATAAVFALGGALVAVAIPALYTFAGAMWLAIAPMAPYIALGTAIGLLAYEIWKNWDPLSELFGGLWNLILNKTSSFLNSLQTGFYTAVNYVMGVLTPLANLFGGSFQATISNWGNNAVNKLQLLGNESDDLSTKMQSNFGVMGNAAKKFNVGLKGIDISNLLPSSTSKPNTVFTGLHNTSMPGVTDDKGADAAAKKAEQAWEQLEKKAKQVSRSIEKEWIQLTGTKIDALEDWKNEELRMLDESKDANENYIRDLGRLNEIYAAKKKKIDEDEINRITQIKRAAQDIMSSYNNKSVNIGFAGVDKQALDLLAGRDKEISDTTRKYEDMVTEFAKLDNTAKANNIKAWQDAGLAFKSNEDGTVDFTEQAEKEKLAIRKDYLEQAKQLHYDRVKYEQDLEQAYSEGDFNRYKELLDSKQAITEQNLKDQQAMMDLYNKVLADSHMSTTLAMAQIGEGAYDGLKSGIADVLTGTKSISEAWSALGSTIGSVIANMAAKWIAAQIAMAIFGKSSQAATGATAATGGATVASAWAPAAAMVSLATFGANAGPAMTGIALTTGLAEVLSGIGGKATGGEIIGPGTGTSDSILSWLSNGEYVIKASAVKALGIDALNTLNTGKMPAFATGGLVTGRSLGSMSYSGANTAKFTTASNDTSSQQTQATGSAPVSFSINALDGKSVEKWLRNGGGEKIRRYFSGRASNFDNLGFDS